MLNKKTKKKVGAVLSLFLFPILFIGYHTGLLGDKKKHEEEREREKGEDFIR